MSLLATGGRTVPPEWIDYIGHMMDAYYFLTFTEATEVFLQRGWNPAIERNPFESILGAQRLRFLKKPQESDRLERIRGWHVILAASGI